MKLEFVDYQKALGLYNKLSKKEKLFVAPRGQYIDSPKLSFRLGLLDNDNLAGFIDVYEFHKGEGFIIIAVDPDYRGIGVAKKLLKASIAEAVKNNFDKLIYKVDKVNEVSNNFIIDSIYNFVLVSETDKDLTYELQLK